MLIELALRPSARCPSPFAWVNPDFIVAVFPCGTWTVVVLSQWVPDCKPWEGTTDHYVLETDLTPRAVAQLVYEAAHNL